LLGQKEAKLVKSELKKEEAKPTKFEPVTSGKAATKVKSEDAKPVSNQRPGEDEESSDDDDNENEVTTMPIYLCVSYMAP
jgi:hypothetical protein